MSATSTESVPFRQMGAYHSRNGLMFRRVPDGVDIWLEDPSTFRICLPAEEWASVVAAVSAAGESREAWDEAFAFYVGGQPI